MSCTSSSCKKNAAREVKEKNVAYRERNKLAAVFSRLAQQKGWQSCLWPETNDWWILFIFTPWGQVSWHITQGEALTLYWVPTAEINPWDGHTTEEKYLRIDRMLSEL